jgi:hypothetical protein
MTFFFKQLFKQAESDEAEGMVSTGWETFIDAVIQAGFDLLAWQLLDDQVQLGMALAQPLQVFRQGGADLFSFTSEQWFQEKSKFEGKRSRLL